MSPSFECEDCDTKFIHQETTHGVIDSKRLSELDTKDYYDFYDFNENCHEKIDSSEEVIAKPDHEYVVGVIVIAAFLALSCSKSQK